MLSFCQWLQATSFFTELRSSGIFYPTILSLHMVAIAFFGCMILVTDLRLLGVGLKSYPIDDLLARLRGPKQFGFVMIVVCGLLLFGTKAEEYYYNAFFRAKVALLLLMLIHGAIFRAGVYGNGAALQSGGVTGQAKLAAGLSLVLWIALAVCGRGIGYIEPNLFKLHAQLPYILGVMKSLHI
jgi:hypothetical protein